MAVTRSLAPVPDRSLAAPAPLPRVVVRLNRYHPFIYKKMVVPPAPGMARANDGDLVQVVDREGRHVGYGLWNARSQIALRMLTHADEPPGEAFWEERIERAAALRRDWLALEASTNAYRVIHAEGDGLSGLIVDRYDDVLSAEVFSLGIYHRIGPLLERVGARLGTTHYRVSVDEHIAEAEGFIGRPLASPEAPSRATISEHGVRYRVRFDEGHKTGFFCDQRENRKALAAYCRGREVLDLCCYTGGFALNALVRGGASEVTGVDLDEKAIAAARENAHLNQARLGLVHADAFGYARQMAVNGKRYGAIVLDPPKLIRDREEMAAGKRKYYDLNVLAFGLVAPGGLFLTCSCSGLLGLEEFLGLVRAAARQANREAQVVNITGAAADHPVALHAPEGAYLKAVWLRVV